MSTVLERRVSLRDRGDFERQCVTMELEKENRLCTCFLFVFTCILLVPLSIGVLLRTFRD